MDVFKYLEEQQATEFQNFSRIVNHQNEPFVDGRRHGLTK